MMDGLLPRVIVTDTRRSDELFLCLGFPALGNSRLKQIEAGGDAGHSRAGAWPWSCMVGYRTVKNLHAQAKNFSPHVSFQYVYVLVSFKDW